MGFAVVVGSGPVVPGAVPDGTFGDTVLPPLAPDGEPGEPIVPVVPDGVPALSGLEPLPGALLVVVAPLLVSVAGGVAAPVVDVEPVVLVVDGFDIVLSVFGASLLLQAPSAATVAAIATHFIE